MDEFESGDEDNFLINIDWLERVKNLPLYYWDDRNTVWKWIRFLAELEEVETIFYLLDLDQKLSYFLDNTPYYWYFLVKTEIFTYNSLVKLFRWVSRKYAFDGNNRKLLVPLQISTTEPEVFIWILKLYGEGVFEAFILAEQIYEEINDEKFDISFYQRCREIQNEEPPVEKEYPLEALFIERIVERSQFAPIPSYLIEAPNEIRERIIDEITLIPNEILDIESLPHKVQKYLVQRPNLVQNYQREYSLSKFRKELEDSTELCRMFGPANRFARADLTKNDNCSIYGGCRMLLCECFTEPNEGTWFLGYCQVCLQKIMFPNFAVRKQINGGGWKGVFCKPECLEKYLKAYSLEIEPSDGLLTSDELQLREDLAAILPISTSRNIQKIIETNGIYSPIKLTTLSQNLRIKN